VDRGLLLYNIRNEIRMTINSLNHIRESGIAFGMRTALRYNIKDIETDKNVIRIQFFEFTNRIALHLFSSWN